MCVCVSVYIEVTDRQGDKETKIEGQSGVKEKRVIKRFRKAHFTFTQRLTERPFFPASSVPMSLHLTASGRRISVTNFAASRRISMTLLSRAKAGASGKEATNRETNPYWMTVNEQANRRRQFRIITAAVSDCVCKRMNARLTHFHVLGAHAFIRLERKVFVKLLLRPLLFFLCLAILSRSFLSLFLLYGSVHLFQLTARNVRGCNQG